MSNGKDERMVGTIKKATGRLVEGNPKDWHKKCLSAVQGYRCRPLTHGKSPFELLYGVRPRITSAEAPSTISGTAEGRAVDIIALSGVRTGLQLKEVEGRENSTRCAKEYKVGDSVLVAYGKALDSSVKWPAFKSRYFGPCRVIRARHPLYDLESTQGRHSRIPIHARRLRPYLHRPIDLKM